MLKCHKTMTSMNYFGSDMKKSNRFFEVESSMGNASKKNTQIFILVVFYIDNS